jgi:hypothetical protein
MQGMLDRDDDLPRLQCTGHAVSTHPATLLGSTQDLTGLGY